MISERKSSYRPLLELQGHETKTKNTHAAAKEDSHMTYLHLKLKYSI